MPLWGAERRVLDAAAALAEHGTTGLILEPVGEERSQLEHVAQRLPPALHALASPLT